MTWLRRIAAPSLVLAALSSVPACTDDDDMEMMPPDPDAIDAAVVMERVAAWRQSPLKACTIEHVLGEVATADARPMLDGAIALERLRGRLSIREPSGALVVLGEPTGADLALPQVTREIRVRTATGEVSTLVVSISVDSIGRCTVQAGDVSYRADLWATLPIVVHAAAPGEAVTREAVPAFFAKQPAEGLGYVELGSLDAVRAALNAPAGIEVVARALAMPAAQLAPIVVQVPSRIDSATIDGGLGPFVLDRPSLADPDALPFIPFDAAHADALLPAGSPRKSTVRVRIRRWALLTDGSRESSETPLEIPVEIALEPRGPQIAVTVTKVGEPRNLHGGEAAAIACFKASAHHALAYAASPRVGAGVEYPRAMGASLTSTRTVIAPCNVFTGRSLSSLLRGDPAAMTLLSKLIDPASYAGAPERASLPGGWDTFLSWMFRSEADLQLFERAGDPSVVQPGIMAQRTLWSSDAYRRGLADHKLTRAAMVWNAVLRCRFAPTADEIQSLVGVPNGDVQKAYEAIDRCPWTR